VKRLSLVLLGALLCAVPVARLLAHVRLAHPSSGTPLRWSSPSAISVVVQADGSDDVAGPSDAIALRLALADWNALTGTSATLVEDATPTSRARKDWEAGDIHLLLFDEDNSSGFFPGGSPTVAITPVWFFSNGVIEDADILFNGAGYSFTTRGEPGAFDIQNVAAHELGHLLGLDHSGNASATMYPYVDQGVVLQRSLSLDEVGGLRDAYPSGSFGRLTGTVVRAGDASAVAGAYVVARNDEGRTVAAILAGTDGSFTLKGLVPGSYTVYARPFDGPVDADNLGSFWASRIDTDFEPALYGAPAVIAGTETVALGTLEVGDDVSLSLGSPIDQFPLRATEGASQTLVVRGSGLFVGSTLAAADPDFVVANATWLGTQVSFQLTVPADEPAGHVDLVVTNSVGKISILSAALEVAGELPTVTDVIPAEGSAAGGEDMTIQGTGFRDGLRIVVGATIYTDGIDCDVLDENTIVLATTAQEPGEHDVVVIDPSGGEGRAVAGFRARSVPVIASVLPRGGDANGGTEVVLAGSGFMDGAAVRIDGVDQGVVTVEGDGTARFTTLGAAPGGPFTLELENPDGSVTAQSFVYVTQVDPEVTGVSPTSGSSGGGTTLTLTGSGFTPSMQVSFLAELAGTEVAATSTTYIDANTLEVVTPAHAAGTVALFVADASECGTLSESAFTFTGGGGGGGGGCYTVPFQEPRGPREWLAASWWLLALFFVLTAGARRRRDPSVPAS
jgi:hypothetical protein